jgi:hypothetical protein
LILTAINLFWTHAVAGKTKKIDTLEGELKAATINAIGQQIAMLRAEQAGPLLLINQQIAAIQRRLELGDERFHKLEEKDHALQVEVLKALADLKDMVATKDDLRRLREEMHR